jgi:hypothetical protein
MASSSSSPGLEEDRLLVALNAARDDVAAAYLAGGSVNTTISAARARGTVQISHDASEADSLVARADARVEIAESSAAAASDAAAQAAADVAVAHASNPNSNSPQLFGTGQSVLHWWAGWFSSCLEGATPKQINKNNRPALYSAEIIAYVGYRSIVYAGVSTAGHCYHVC